MGFIKGLKCRECGHPYPAEPLYVCEYCFGPLEVDYDYEAIAKAFTKRALADRPATMWRYREVLPVASEKVVDLGTGFTPLVRADNLGKLLGLKHLYLKNDAVNPTYSFKDRVVATATTMAIEFGYDTIACASTGNLAGSVAAHAAKAGLACYVLIPADLERGKVLGAAIYEPHLVAVRGNYDEVNKLSSEIADRYGWAFVNINLRPYYSEGAKSLGWETVEQLGWRAPDHVVVPMAGASVITKIGKGLREAAQLGFVPEMRTKISGAQATGCNPVVAAIKASSDVIKPVKPETIAKSLAIGNPADGYYALRTITESGGYAEDVSDPEVIEGIRLLARTEGIFTETAGGVTVGVLKKLAEQGKIDPDGVTVAYITGNGLKTTEAIENHVAAPQVIDPALDAFAQLVPGDAKRSA